MPIFPETLLSSEAIPGMSHREYVRKPIILERKRKLEEDSKGTRLMHDLDREPRSLGSTAYKEQNLEFQGDVDMKECGLWS